MSAITSRKSTIALTERQGYGGLLETLDQAVSDCRDRDSRIALLMIDMSATEMLVPAIGYRKICEILDAAGIQLEGLKRPKDILTRIDDQHFALIIFDVKFPAMADLAANKIIESLDGLRGLSGMHTSVHPVIGIVLFPEHGESAEDLLMQAENTIEAAHQANLRIMHAGGSHNELITRNKVLEAELESAFMNSQFELHYQPKVNLQTHRLYGAEALIRWQHPEHGFISPVVMVPIIEKSRLLQDITLWILNTALNQSRLMRALSPDFRIAVNISPQLLESPELVELVSRGLRIWDVDPHLLILEITETSIMVNEEVAQKNLRELSEAGVMLSIDDFGTGYSSYSYLQQLPIQEMKIDKSFITTLLTEKNNERLVKSMINLGKELGINVLAEGIETPEIQQRLIDLGCQYGQGFLISRPLPAAEITRWIEATDWNSQTTTE
jgi:EAL domain-containing protein (putative c-di-GMP-specific phosphodiesterase class I)/GGDEF domain-containing protein